jgi:hypothetical protein
MDIEEDKGGRSGNKGEEQHVYYEWGREGVGI